MSRQKQQSELYDLQVKAYVEALNDSSIEGMDRIKLLESLRNFLKDNGTTAAAVEEKLQAITQTKIKDGVLDDAMEDLDDEEFDPGLRIVSG